MDPGQGLWSGYGAPASVDWCEANYRVVSWLAEWWNVCSSAPMLVVGLGAFVLSLRGQDPLPWRFRICFLGFAVVGAGSMAFHGTLLHVAQVLDELPMVYCALLMAYCLAVRESELPKATVRVGLFQLMFGTYALGFTVAYALSTSYFILFVVSFAAVVAYVVIRGGFIVFRRSRQSILRKLYVGAALAFCAAVFLFWFPERGLGCDHTFQELMPHAWFHLLAGTGTYLGFLVVIYDHYELHGQKPRLKMLPLPWVRAESRAAALTQPANLPDGA